MKPGWDDHSFAVAKEMYLGGASHGDIARSLAHQGYSLSRNAVIGKMNRSGVADGRSVVPRNDGAPKAKRPPMPRVIETIKPSKPLPVLKEEKAIEYIGPIGTTPAWGLCQFTRDDINKRDGEGRPAWQMCGHPAIVKGEGRNRTQTPWCEAHNRICHQPAHKKHAA